MERVETLLRRLPLFEDFSPTEMSLITGEPTVADVVVVERCELLLIPQDVFYEFRAVNPTALRVIAKTITERLRQRERDEAAQTRVEGAWQNAPDPYGLELSTATPMRILAASCANSALKFSYFDTAQETNHRSRYRLTTSIEANAANIRTGMVGYLAGVQDRR